MVDRPFNWEGDRSPSGLRVGYLEEAFTAEGPSDSATARGNNAANCAAACAAPVVISTDLCQQGSSNTSGLDNFLPNLGM